MTALGEKMVGESRSQDKKRQSILLRGKVVDHAGRLLDISIRNISQCGLKAACKEPFPVKSGDNITIILPQDVKLAGVVRWFDGVAFGVEFLEPFDTSTASAAIQSHVAAVPQWKVSSLHRVAQTSQPDPERVRFI